MIATQVGKVFYVKNPCYVCNKTIKNPKTKINVFSLCDPCQDDKNVRDCLKLFMY